MSILFINGSPNKNGNTAALAAELLKGHEYETLNLTDYTIGAYGQNLPGDGLDAVIGAMKQADTIVIGSPLYWHNICGSVRLTADDADHRARQLRLLHRWASESTPLTFVMSEDRVALVNDRALVERLLEPTN